MTNDKIASQDGQLKLFAGGRQIKSLVPVIDVARCFKIMEERDDLSKELFNYGYSNSKRCCRNLQKNNPKIQLKETNDEVPNLGFSLSKKKLFEFRILNFFMV